jgi:guanine nucleotide-binding protein G(i) subunit alpha
MQHIISKAAAKTMRCGHRHHCGRWLRDYSVLERRAAAVRGFENFASSPRELDMADPVTIVGATAAVADILGLLCKTISTVSELRRQWRDADSAVFTFETQLITLKTALAKIQEWMDANFDDPHHQLVMDLDRCIACCGMLIGNIDTQLASIQTSRGSQLDITSKLRLLFKTKGIKDIQEIIDRQTNALTLLLTACNWYVITITHIL